MDDGGLIPEGVPAWDPADDLGCFIPLDPDDFRRSRSRAIWAEAGGRLGMTDG